MVNGLGPRRALCLRTLFLPSSQGLHMFWRQLKQIFLCLLPLELGVQRHRLLFLICAIQNIPFIT